MKKHSDDFVVSFREDFRYHLEQFYSYLHLAPPYNSVEKAVRFLSTSLQQKSQDEREQLAENSDLKWALFEQAFIESGLPQKHRGIICGLVKSQKCPDLPSQYSVFTKPFLPDP